MEKLHSTHLFIYFCPPLRDYHEQIHENILFTAISFTPISAIIKVRNDIDKNRKGNINGKEKI